MKKLISILLFVTLLAGTCAALASCSHTHTWDEGRVTRPATAEVPGVKTYTCTGCEETKTEPTLYVRDTDVTADEWATAFNIDTSYYSVTLTVEAEGFSMYVEQAVDGNVIRFIEGDESGIAVDYMENAEGGHYYYNDETESADLTAERTYTKRFVSFEDTHGDDEFLDTKNAPIRYIEPFADKFNNFAYDAENGCYTAAEIENYKNVEIYFSDGKISKVIYDTNYHNVFEFDFENVYVTLPVVE